MKVVVKIGGSLLEKGVPEELLDDIGELRSGTTMVLVHGGGDVVTEVATKLGKQQRFVVSPDGIRSRYTDRETAEIYTMVMSGLVAKKLVLALRRRGVNAMSLTGVDGSLFRGRRKKKLAIIDERGRKVLIEGGYTGRVESVNAFLVESLASGGYLPVVSPIAISEDFEPLNIDGDRAASSLATGISADAVVFATDVAGVMLDGKLIDRIPVASVPEFLPRIGYGMQKKVMAAADAVNSGVKEAIICSGSGPSPLSRALSHEGCTVVSA